jgi:hypothetical protein
VGSQFKITKHHKQEPAKTTDIRLAKTKHRNYQMMQNEFLHMSREIRGNKNMKETNRL